MERRIWDNYLTERDKVVYSAAGYGKKSGFGNRPAVVVIDVQNNFIGDKPEPILDSIKKYRTSCGEEGWQALSYIKRVVEKARQIDIPIFYTISERRKDFVDSGIQTSKNHRAYEETSVQGNVIIPPEIKPREKDIVISKRKPSAFYGTYLASYLNQFRVDTLILVGSTTSGCIRATSVDSYSYNYHTILIEEGIFDRGQASHAINLFDINSKYGDVLPFEEIMNYLNQFDKE